MKTEGLNCRLPKSWLSLDCKKLKTAKLKNYFSSSLIDSSYIHLQLLYISYSLQHLVFGPPFVSQPLAWLPPLSPSQPAFSSLTSFPPASSPAVASYFTSSRPPRLPM